MKKTTIAMLLLAASFGALAQDKVCVSVDGQVFCESPTCPEMTTLVVSGEGASVCTSRVAVRHMPTPTNVAVFNLATRRECAQTEAGEWVKVDCGGGTDPYWYLNEAGATVCQAQPNWRKANHIIKAPFRLMVRDLDVGASSLAECQRRGEAVARKKP